MIFEVLFTVVSKRQGREPPPAGAGGGSTSPSGFDAADRFGSRLQSVFAGLDADVAGDGLAADRPFAGLDGFDVRSLLHGDGDVNDPFPDEQRVLLDGEAAGEGFEFIALIRPHQQRPRRFRSQLTNNVVCHLFVVSLCLRLMPGLSDWNRTGGQSLHAVELRREWETRRGEAWPRRVSARRRYAEPGQTRSKILCSW